MATKKAAATEKMNENLPLGEIPGGRFFAAAVCRTESGACLTSQLPCDRMELRNEKTWEGSG